MAYKQQAALDLGGFKQFWAFHLVPCVIQNRSSLLHCTKPSRIVKTEFGLFLNFQKSIFIIHALLTCFDCLFMFRIKYASYLGGLIAFWMPGSSYAMIRVSYAVLGFLYTGKIGPWDLCQWTRNNALSRTMVLDVIFITFVWFFELARNVASNKGRRWIFKYLKGWRRSLARAGGDQRATHVYSTYSVSKQLTHLAQLVSALVFKDWS